MFYLFYSAGCDLKLQFQPTDTENKLQSPSTSEDYIASSPLQPQHDECMNATGVITCSDSYLTKLYIPAIMSSTHSAP